LTVAGADDTRKSEEGRQNVVVHEGAPADPNYDTNEAADDKANIVEPDGSASPRPLEDEDEEEEGSD
jgi:hypothetical protein